MKYLALNVVIFFLIGSASHASEIPTAILNIYWSDGDSGKIDGNHFRLWGVDAPETTGVGSSYGGAKCEVERVLGYDAKAFMLALSSSGDLAVATVHGEDRYGRIVVEITVDGVSVAAVGLASGHLRSWRHDSSGVAIEEKPNWCL